MCVRFLILNAIHECEPQLPEIAPNTILYDRARIHSVNLLLGKNFRSIALLINYYQYIRQLLYATFIHTHIYTYIQACCRINKLLKSSINILSAKSFSFYTNEQTSHKHQHITMDLRCG